MHCDIIVRKPVLHLKAASLTGKLFAENGSVFPNKTTPFDQFYTIVTGL